MTQARQAPAAPTPPGPARPATPVAGTPAPNIISTGALTAGDVDALRARKNELSNLLQNVTNRRKEVQNSLRTATTPSDRGGLEQRLSYLDGRITRIEADIDQNSTQLASIEAMRATVSVPPPRFSPRDRAAQNMVPIAVVFTLFVLSPIALTFSRMLWRRGGSPRATATPENNERMVRMEQAIDSIAIEIERVSEGQRFVTRLLAEGNVPSQLGVAQPAKEPAQRRY